MTIPAEQFNEDTIKDGIGFDASNYGYAVAEKSDMVFIPVFRPLNKRKECLEMAKIPHPA